MSGLEETYGARCGELIAGNYRLDHVLGVGGMGVVYSACQKSLDREVALKLPRPELACDPDVRHRLRMEALASSRVDHRNSVRMLDYGTHAGAPYLVMELVTGPRLGQLLHEHGPLPLATALALVMEINAALQEAHLNGIVHADVKCDNVLVETLRDGTMRPRLIDWGIARFCDDLTEPTEVVTGTPEYLAPEVGLGERATFAADVYAIGVMLYELISGATPFAGSAQVMVSKLEDAVVPVTLRCPGVDIPPALDELILRCLSRDPEQRYPDARALGATLASIARTIDVRKYFTRPEPAPIFSTEATTATMAAVGPVLVEQQPRVEHRASVLTALESRDVDAIVVAYLDLARALVDEHQLSQAIVELEGAYDLLSTPAAGLADPAQVWRILLTLAALYDGNGQRSKARIAARLARERATRAGSSLGRQRAEKLSARLAHPGQLRSRRAG